MDLKWPSGFNDDQRDVGCGLSSNRASVIEERPTRQSSLDDRMPRSTTPKGLADGDILRKKLGNRLFRLSRLPISSIMSKSTSRISRSISPSQPCRNERCFHWFIPSIWSKREESRPGISCYNVRTDCIASHCVRLTKDSPLHITRSNGKERRNYLCPNQARGWLYDHLDDSWSRCCSIQKCHSRALEQLDVAPLKQIRWG